MTEWHELDGERLRDLSHWRGHGRWAGPEGDAAWLAKGRRHVELLREAYVAAGAAWPPGAVVDYGCGGGSTIVALAEHGCGVYGVDIHRDTIDQARAQAHSERVHFLGLLPDDVPDRLEADALVCTEVVQHLTADVPDVIAFFEGLSRLVRNGGVGLIQTRFNDFGAPPGDVCTQTIMDEETACRLLWDGGWQRVTLTTDEAQGYHYHGVVRR